METRVLLYDSLFCRLCAEENSNGVLLYPSEENGTDLSVLVNKFLPLKINNDGKMPRTICPGCNIQLQSTVQFLELVVEGQRKLRDMWKLQIDYQRRQEREQMKTDQGELGAISNALLLEGEEAQIFVQLPDGTLFAADHGLALKMEGLERPRRKRGRPPKKTADPLELAPREDESKEPEPEQDADETEDIEEDGDGRRRRRKKIPRRFMEAVQGKELERIFREEGVIDEEDEEEQKPGVDEKPVVEQDTPDEVIGHLETPEGRDLGELVVINKGRGRGRPRNSRKRKINYECDICGRGFQHHGRYIFHKTYHKGVKYGCGTCQKLFTSKELLELHHKTMEHSGEEIIERKKGEDPETANTLNCLKCNKDFDTRHNYELHLKSVHEGEKPFSCTICSKSFAYQASLKYHVLSQHEAKQYQDAEKSEIRSDGKGGYVCDICGKVLNHPSSVVYHKEAEHNNGRRFVCNKCNKSFKHKQLLQRHQLVHSDDRPFVCTMCSRSFKTRANWLNHQSTHSGEKKYFCELCGQQFAHKTSLTLHYRWHAGHKPYECEVCKKKFSQNGNLQEHLRIHSGEKPFSCEFCGRKFTTSSQFKLHVKRHTGERPWKCEFCGKSFLHKDTWKCHTRRHKGERPFQCNHCNKGFTEQWALKKHIRMHTGEKPYSCNICLKAFADCSNLTKHKKVHQENKVPSAAANSAALPDSEFLPLERALYKIIETQLSQDEELENATADSSHVPRVAAIADTSAIGDTSTVQQIIYVYQDPDDPSEPRTLHMMDEVNQTTDEVRPAANFSNLKMIQPSDDGPSLVDLRGPSNGDTDPLDLQHLMPSHTMQVTDEDGNPIQLTMQDGRQLQITTVDGQSLLVTTDDGRTIPVQFTTPEGHPINAGYLNGISAPDVQSACVSDGLIVEQTASDAQTVTDAEHAYEFTTQDGQKVRLVAAFDVSPLHMPPDFIGPSIPQVQ